MAEVGLREVGKLGSSFAVPFNHCSVSKIGLVRGSKNTIVRRVALRRPMGQHGFNLGRAHKRSDGEAARVASHD